MRNVSRDQAVANFEELVAENQVQTAVELLVSAEPEDQLTLIEQTNPMLLGRLFEALSEEDRVDVTDQLAEEARQSLMRVLEDVGLLAGRTGIDETLNKYLATRAAEEFEQAGLGDRRAPAEARAFGVPSPRRRDFTIVDGRLVETNPGVGTITVYSNPTAQEQRALVDVFEIDEHTLASALDPDEISRLEFDEAAKETFIVWTRPRRGESEVPELLGLTSMGIFLDADHLTIVSGDEAPVLRAGDRADSLRDLVLRIMASTVNEFLVELKTIKRASQDIGQKLSRSLENRQLLKMFDLSEGLVYHMNAIDANGGVLRRLRALGPRLGFDEAGIELLDDIVVDNTQCLRQAQTFSTILAGLMDARGNLINNNMNVLLKNLTIINVVFLPLGVVASMGGMSEFTMILDHYSVDWRIGYLAFTAGIVALGYVLLKGVRFWIERMFSG